MRQFYLTPPADGPLVEGASAVLDPQESHHLRTVLRGGRQDVIALTDGRGRRYRARVLPGRDALVTVTILAAAIDETELLPPRLVLALAAVKGSRFEWALEKAVELGAHRIVPLAADRGVVLPGAGKRQRWSGILASALKQSGRAWLPDLAEPADLAQVLAAAQGPVWFGAAPDDRPDASPLPGGAVRPAPPAGATCPPQVCACIGPEGGWSPRELALLAEAGALPLSLGPHVLRTETAALAALAVLQPVVGELRARAAADAAAGGPGGA